MVSAVRHAIFRTAAVNIAMLIATTITGILVARSLGESGRGQFASIVAVQGIAYVVGEVGQSVAVTFAVSRAPGSAAQALASSRRIMIPASLLVTVLGCVGAFFHAGGDRAVFVAYLLALCSILVNALGGPALYALQAWSITAWNRVRLAQPTVYLLSAALLFATGRLTIVLASAAMLVSYAVSMGFAVVMERRLRPPPAADAALPVSLVGYGLKQAGSSIPEVLSGNIDRVLLLGLVGAPALGQYAVAQSVVSAAGPMGTAVSAVVFPSLAADVSTAGVRRRRELRIFGGAGILTATALVLLGLVSGWAVPLLFGEVFRPAAPLVWLLAPTVLLRALLQVSGTILRGRGTPGLATISNVVCLVTTTTLLIVLSARFGLPGAAAATAIGQAAGLAVSVFLVTRRVTNAAIR